MIPEKVIGVICEKNPEIPLLKEALHSLEGQMENVIVVDSSDLPEIRTALKEVEKEFAGFATFMWNADDPGNSASFHQGSVAAVERGADWVITLNDDTILEPGFVAKMLDAYHALSPEDQKTIGLVTPNIKSARGLAFPDGDPVINSDGGNAEGQLVKTSIFPVVGYWDDKLFIDYVDGEFSCRVQMYGFKTLRVPHAVVQSRLGNPVMRRFLWKTAMIPNYRPYRYYYMCRNTIYLYVRNFRTYILRNNHWKDAFWALIIPRFFIKMILFEDNRAAKIRASWRGICDGFRGRMGPMPK